MEAVIVIIQCAVNHLCSEKSKREIFSVKEKRYLFHIFRIYFIFYIFRYYVYMEYCMASRMFF